MLFLYLPLATKVEHEDAIEAQKWIDSLSPREKVEQREWVVKLAARYGMLFGPRVMVCRRCLGMRYGINPEYGRLKMQRRAAARRGETGRAPAADSSAAEPLPLPAKRYRRRATA